MVTLQAAPAYHRVGEMGGIAELGPRSVGLSDLTSTRF